MSIKPNLEFENKVFSSNSYGNFKIIKYYSASKIEIEFITTKYKTFTNLSNIKKGSVKDLYYPNIYNIGFIGSGKYTSRINGIQVQSYKRWKEMLNRCYNDKCSSYKNYGAKGVYVCKEWHNYQNYAKWWEENCTDNTQVVDKDILVKGNKCYCPERCCFVPNSINTVFTFRKAKRGIYPIGVRLKGGKIISQINYMGNKIHLGTFNTIEEAFKAYKIAKEKCIKEYADKHKKELTDKVYKALYNYIIEITD